MSPQFIPMSSSSFISSTSTSNTPTSSYSSKRDQTVATQSVQSKPLTLSFEPKMQSRTDWKDVSKGVPIRTRRFTTIVSTDKPTLKSMLQRPLIDKPSATLELPPNLQHNNSALPKQIPKSIRERRYTTIVSTGTKSLSKGIHQNIRPPINVKNFELVQNPRDNKLTLAPIPTKPVTESSTHLLLNRPVIIKKIDTGDSVVQSTSVRQRRDTIDRSPPSSSNKQTNVKPTTSATASKLSTPSIVVVKPSSFNLQKKVSTASIALDGKSVVMQKIRLIPSNVKIIGKNNIVKNITEKVIDSDDDSTAPPPRKQQQMSAMSMSAGTNNTVHGYLISQIRGLGKIVAKKLFAAYSVKLLDGTKLFQTFKHCTDYLNT